MLADDDWNAHSLMLAGAERLLRATDDWQAYTLDDTALLKHGLHSVGVSKQYAGCVGHVTNCQSIVTMGLASDVSSTLILTRLFFPKTWFGSKSKQRREAAHVPESILRRGHQTKQEIALGLVEQLRLEGMPMLPFLCDSGYGGDTAFRQALAARGAHYVAGVTLDMSVWDADVTFEMPPHKLTRGRPATRMRPTGGRTPKSVLKMAKGLPSGAWTHIMWREGSRGQQQSRFAAVRVRAARGYDTTVGTVTEVHDEEWLLVHWPDDEPEPTMPGCRTCRRTRACCASCSSRVCAGASSEITKRARSCSGSITTRGAAGTGYTTISRWSCSRSSSSRSNGGKS
jgi:SRSO17 transposase